MLRCYLLIFNCTQKYHPSALELEANPRIWMLVGSEYHVTYGLTRILKYRYQGKSWHLGKKLYMGPRDQTKVWIEISPMNRGPTFGRVDI